METTNPLIVSWFWQVTVVAALAMLATTCFCKKRPRIAYVIWMLVVVKCLIPPLWSSKTGIFSWSETQIAKYGEAADQNEVVGVDGDSHRSVDASQSGLGESYDLNPELSDASASGQTTLPKNQVRSKSSGIAGDVSSLLLTFWAGGCLVLMILAVARRIQFHRHCFCPNRTTAQMIEPMIGRIGDRLGIRRPVRFLVSSGGFGPAAYGLVNPTVVVPRQLARSASPEELELVIAHEMVHIRRQDNLTSLFQLVAQIVWWFHPLIWKTSRSLTRERERCCDDSVLAIFSFGRTEYAQTLLNVLKGRNQAILPAMVSGMRSADVTLQRLETIMDSKRKLCRSTPLSAWIILVAGFILFCPGKSISGQEQHEDDPAKNETVESAKKLQSIMFALHTFHNIDGHYPSASVGWGFDYDTHEWYRHRPNLSWRVSLLPFIGEAELFKEFRHDEPWDSEHNKALISRMPDIYRAVGSEAKPGHTNYFGVVGDNAAFHPSRGVYSGDFEDGTVRTIMLVEVSDEHAVPWTKPVDVELPADGTVEPEDLVGLRRNGFLACMADGSPKLVAGEIPDEMLQHLFVRNDHNVVMLDSQWIKSAIPADNMAPKEDKKNSR